MSDTRPRRRQKDLCFTRRHLKMNEVAYHDYALAVSRESGIFYRDDRRDAKEFLASKSAICRIAQAVEQKGFMILLEPRTRLANGQLASGKYKVLTHEEWAADHQGECRGESQCTTQPSSACPADGTGNDASQSQNECPPVPFSEGTCPTDGTGPVPFSASACPTGGTKNREERIENTEKREERRERESESESDPPLSSSLAADAATAMEKPDVKEVEALAGDLYRMGSHLILSGKAKVMAESFLREFPRLFVTAAFAHYHDALDDFESRHAIRRFFAEEGGRAPIIAEIEKQRRREENDKLVAAETERLRQQAEDEYAESERLQAQMNEGALVIGGGSSEPETTDPAEALGVAAPCSN